MGCAGQGKIRGGTPVPTTAMGTTTMGHGQTVFILACSSQKRADVAPAKDLYVSKRFRLERKVAEEYGDGWFILSAMHGLLRPETPVAPYESFLPDLSPAERAAWSARVRQELAPFLIAPAHFVCLGEPAYFDDLSDCVQEAGATVSVPFRWLDSGNIDRWLEDVLPESRRARDLKQLYAILGNPALTGAQLRSFRECSGGDAWPRRGLYVFYGPHQRRMLNTGQRKVVRVGTHAVSTGSASSLWQRLRTHKGTDDGRGNHRGSVFRLHVGNALMFRNGLLCASWGKGASADSETRRNEEMLEREVSAYLARMEVLTLHIDDTPSKRSDRAYIEQNMVALLSGPSGPLDFAEESWLGYNCPNAAVRSSCLWNVDYTNRAYDERFLDTLDVYAQVSSGRKQHPEKSIAPRFWYESAKSGYLQGTLDFG